MPARADPTVTDNAQVLRDFRREVEALNSALNTLARSRFTLDGGNLSQLMAGLRRNAELATSAARMAGAPTAAFDLIGQRAATLHQLYYEGAGIQPSAYAFENFAIGQERREARAASSAAASDDEAMARVYARSRQLYARRVGTAGMSPAALAVMRDPAHQQAFERFTAAMTDPQRQAFLESDQITREIGAAQLTASYARIKRGRDRAAYEAVRQASTLSAEASARGEPVPAEASATLLDPLLGRRARDYEAGLSDPERARESVREGSRRVTRERSQARRVRSDAERARREAEAEDARAYRVREEARDRWARMTVAERIANPEVEGFITDPRVAAGAGRHEARFTPSQQAQAEFMRATAPGTPGGRGGRERDIFARLASGLSWLMPTPGAYYLTSGLSATGLFPSAAVAGAGAGFAVGAMVNQMNQLMVANQMQGIATQAALGTTGGQATIDRAMQLTGSQRSLAFSRGLSDQSLMRLNEAVGGAGVRSTGTDQAMMTAMAAVQTLGMTMDQASMLLARDMGQLGFTSQETADRLKMLGQVSLATGQSAQQVGQIAAVANLQALVTTPKDFAATSAMFAALGGATPLGKQLTQAVTTGDPQKLAALTALTGMTIEQQQALQRAGAPGIAQLTQATVSGYQRQARQSQIAATQMAVAAGIDMTDIASQRQLMGLGPTAAADALARGMAAAPPTGAIDKLTPLGQLAAGGPAAVNVPRSWWDSGRRAAGDFLGDMLEVWTGNMNLPPEEVLARTHRPVFGPFYSMENWLNERAGITQANPQPTGWAMQASALSSAVPTPTGEDFAKTLFGATMPGQLLGTAEHLRRTGTEALGILRVLLTVDQAGRQTTHDIPVPIGPTNQQTTYGPGR